MRIELPFPAASLSGHAKGNAQWKKIADTKSHREWARLATLAAGQLELPSEGDISLSITFTPANRRGDRLNFPNRIKPYADGIADALGINDSRFLPSYHFTDPEAPGRVVLEVSTL